MGLEIIQNSPFFEEEWYLETYPDVALLGMDPAEHYLTIGGHLLRDPGPNFSTSAYLSQNRDVAAHGMNALRHYELHGRDKGRLLASPQGVKDVRDTTQTVPIYEGPPPADLPARVVSFYLPQFHPIAENDEWWGEGFTEWTNVRPAKPVAPGHYQPHVPGELGYYDLRDPQVQRRQVELAQLYGVEAFCFYFYWFAGKRLLETPIRNYLDDPTLELPFMLCWANENWSRRWDGRDNDLLISQQHTPEDDLAFIEYIAEYLTDPRYERIDGRPVLLVYRPNLLPDPAATAARWRAWCRENGVGEIYLAYTQSFESTDPREYGFDAAIEFPPNNSGIRGAHDHPSPFPSFKGRVFRWDDLVDHSYTYAGTPYRQYRGLCPSWDNTARRGAAATILAGSSPARFTRWVSHAVRDTRRRSHSEQDRFVFVNAWNEWAEGAHLEPDQRYGYAWLESIRVGLACGAESSHVDETSTVEVVRGLSISELLRRLPEWESRGVSMVVSLDSQDRPDVDVDDLRRHFATDRDLGMIALGALDAFTELMPFISRIAARLGLDETEAARFDWRGTRSFAARLSALRPLASLAFDEADEDPSDPRFTPALGDVLTAALPLSAAASDCRVSGFADDDLADPMSIVLVTHDAHPHGAQRLVLHLARHYTAMGFTVDLLVLGSGSLLDDFRRTATVHQLDLDLDPPGRILGILQGLRDRGASWAIANTTASGALSPWLKRVGFTVVSLVHEMSGVLNDMDMSSPAEQLQAHADVVVFPSEVVRQQFESFTGHACTTHAIRPQGIYLSPTARDDTALLGGDLVRQRHAIAPDAPIVLGVGYADFRKGLDLFADACIEIFATDPGAVGMWVGHLGPEDFVAEVRARLVAAGVHERFIFTGLVDDATAYYSASDVFLLSSREDPFPSVVLEAMDAAVPVIAFRGATGSQELVERGAGVLVDAFDAVAMGQQALALLGAPDRRATLGSAGRAIVQREFRFRDYAYDLAAFGGIDLPKVSVVVPNYNYARLLYARLESISAQTMPVYEVIVLDDASTDDSVAVVEKFAENSALEIELLVNETNSGSVFRQWRRGVERATGDLIWIAEADDLSDPGFLRRVTEAFADEDVVMSYCQSKILDANGNVVESDYLDYVSDIDPQKWSSSYRHAGTEEIRTALHVKNTVPNVSTVVFRREALLETLQTHGDEIVAYPTAGDWVTYLRLLEKGQISFSPESLNSHRRHAGSVTTSNFTVDLLRQIIEIQRDTIERFGLGEEASTRAATYAEELYRQFGLVTDQHPTVDSHPELSAPGTRMRGPRPASPEVNP